MLKPLLDNWICAVLTERCFYPYSCDSTVSGTFAIEDLLPVVIHWQLLFCPLTYTGTSQFGLQFWMLHFSESRSAIAIAMQEAAI